MMRLRRAPQHGFAGFLALLMAACGGGGSPTHVAGPNPNGTISVNLYPSENDGRRLFVLVNAVGSLSTRIPVAFDTGSAGLTLYAPDIFPANMVDASGFKFPQGSDTLSFEGITVTKLNAVRVYGGQTTGHTQVGNLGFAQVNFGDGAGVTTQTMPVLFYYEVLDTATGTPLSIPIQHGWFGVNDGGGALEVAGSIEPPGGFAECSTSSAATCYVGSVLKYLTYPASVDAGFMLQPATLQDCSIADSTSCAPENILTLGLSASAKTGFTPQALTCPPKDVVYAGPATVGGFNACQSYLENTAVIVNSSSAFSFLSIFDSGTPYMVFSVPMVGNFPSPVPAGDQVTVTLASGFQYSYIAGAAPSSAAAPYATTVVNGPLTDTVVGVDFFTTNSFYIDYHDGTEGFK